MFVCRAHRTLAALAMALGSLVVAEPLSAQTGMSGVATPESTTVVAGAEYGASNIHRRLFGNHYRTLWTTPIRVEVLDLGTFAGGLRPVDGLQTSSLLFVAQDGRMYVFRSVNTDAWSVLPTGLRGTVPMKIAQDQVSAAHPAGAVVAAPLVEAAGAPHRDVQLVYLPDDPRLGEFRAEFGGVLGFLEVEPGQGGAPEPGGTLAPEIVSTDALYEYIRASPRDQVDARQFLLARLLDLLLGTWDRQDDHWTWARATGAGDSLWVAVPRDRDQAFVLFDGLLPAMLRPSFPQLLKFGPKYDPPGTTWSGRNLDRRFLTPLSRPAWDLIVAGLMSALTDSVIDAAVARMPAEYFAINGPVLRAALIRRREALPREAAKYYRRLAEQAELHATDRADSAVVIRVDSRRVQVKVFSEAGRFAGAPPYIDRTFVNSETSEIRLFLHGDNDQAVFEGLGSMPITVRVGGGSGDDAFDDPGRNGKVHFYDETGTSTATGHDVDTKPWPKPPPGVKATRDWGARQSYQPLLAGGPDIGVLFGASATFVQYGFRKVPYSSQWRLRLAYATEAQTLNGDVLGDIRLANSHTHFTLLGRGSGIATLNFYGFGNNTTETQPVSFYRVRQNQYTLEPGVTFSVTRHSRLSLAIKGIYSVTFDDVDRYIGTQTVFGTGEFGEVGASAEYAWAGSSPASLTTTGVSATAGGSIFAPVWSVPTTYGELHAVVNWSWNLHAGGPNPTLGFQVGGKTVFGDYPFMSAAFIGGGSTVRSLRFNRYAGDASLYGSSELRLRVARVSGLLASELGVMGLVDVGRVFLAGESSNTWHPAYGGGLWLAFRNGRTRATVTAAGGEGAARFYFTVGASP